jgi:hypothetical protein
MGPTYQVYYSKYYSMSDNRYYVNETKRGAFWPQLALIAAEPTLRPAGLISNLTESAPTLPSVQA